MTYSILLITLLVSAFQGTFAVLNRNLDASTVGFKQVGHDLLGAAKNVEFGSTVQLSSLDGSRILIGSPLHGWSSSEEDSAVDSDLGGGIFLYEHDGSSWNLLWFLHGEEGEEIGDRVSISADGNRVAVRRYNKTSYKNCAEVYDIDQNGIATLVGSPIVGTANGKTVTLSPNGQRLALSSESFQNSRGRVEVFDWNGNIWSKIGSFTGFENNDRLGFITSFSASGDRLAISAPNYGGGNIVRRGLVRVFEYEPQSKTWSKLGRNINGRAEKDYLGFSMAMSLDGSTLVVGSPGSAGSGTLRGNVRVYRLIDDNWVSQGGEIEGQMDYDRFGRSVTISSSGSRIAASSYFHDAQRGQVRLFDVLNGVWTQVGSSIHGFNRQDRLGFGVLSVTMTADGNRFAVGAAFADKPDGTINTGRVQVYDQALVYPSAVPSSQPSLRATSYPSPGPSSNQLSAPSVTDESSTVPSEVPSTVSSSDPSAVPSDFPSEVSLSPSGSPSDRPPIPTFLPSAFPTTASSPSQSPTDLRLPHTPEPPIHMTASPTRSPTAAPTATKLQSSVPTNMDDTPGLDGVFSEPNTPLETSSALRIPGISMVLLVVTGLVALIGIMTNTFG